MSMFSLLNRDLQITKKGQTNIQNNCISTKTGNDQ